MTGDGMAGLQKFIGEHEVRTIDSAEPTLAEIFIKLTGRELNSVEAE